MKIAYFNRKFSAAHRIQEAGPCGRIHGHNWEVHIKVAVQQLHNGMTINSDKIKDVVDKKYDHMLILHRHDPLRDVLNPLWIVCTPEDPTTENLAQLIAEDVADEVIAPQGHGYVEVTVHETATISAEGRTEW
jgi:6-pyruvoyl tetrahydropterin synthase/QueD family protein